jgi:hypothetical protein
VAGPRVRFGRRQGTSAGSVSLPAHTFSGRFIGGGVEFAVASVPGLYWRNEYRLSSSRPADFPFFIDGVAIKTFDHQSVTVQTITTSLVWKFNATPASAVDMEGKAPPRAPHSGQGGAARAGACGDLDRLLR